MSYQKVEETLDEDSVFYEQIEDEETICSNCYRKVKVIMSSEEWASDQLPESRKQALADRTYFENHTERANPPTRHNSHYFARSCECGSIHGDAKVRPLNKETTMEYAANIVSRLEEAGVDFNDSAFLDEVRWRKQNPDYQFNEELIFQDSLEESIE